MKRPRRSILGRKVGMSQVYDDKGTCIPVTLIEAGPCTVLQKKTEERDGYPAIQVGFADTPKRPKKPQEGLFKKIETAPKRFVREISLVDDSVSEGDILDLGVFEGVDTVDVTGVSKGRGFSGNVRRWNHAIGPKSHGSKAKRVPGSIGMHQDPGRVAKGKNMPGQYGAKPAKIRNLSVVQMDPAENLLIVQGAVPGPRGGFLFIEESLESMESRQ